MREEERKREKTRFVLVHKGPTQGSQASLSPRRAEWSFSQHSRSEAVTAGTAREHGTQSLAPKALTHTSRAARHLLTTAALRLSCLPAGDPRCL